MLTMQTILLWLIPLFPALAALVMGLLPLKHNSRGTHLLSAAALAVNFGLCLWLMFLGDGSVTLFRLGEDLPIVQQVVLVHMNVEKAGTDDFALGRNQKLRFLRREGGGNFISGDVYILYGIQAVGGVNDPAAANEYLHRQPCLSALA